MSAVSNAVSNAVLHGVPPRVLVVAGSDSGGGAGLQADIKTITALGGFAMTAVTALTAQNTKGVVAVHSPPPEFLRLQLEATFSDLGADAVKIGMLHSTSVLEVVVEFLASLPPDMPVVVDPVMVAASGARLLEGEAVEALARRLAPRASLLTPNTAEAECLLGRELAGGEEARVRAARDLLGLGCGAVLLKGGHGGEGAGGEIVDVLVRGDEVLRFSHPRVKLRQAAHGTGCSLASGIATGLGAGLALEAAVRQAVDWLQGALKAAPPFGEGAPTLNHAWEIAAWRGRAD